MFLLPFVIYFPHFKEIISDILQNKKITETMLVQNKSEKWTEGDVHPTKTKRNPLPSPSERYF